MSIFQVAEQSETEPSFMRDCSTFELTNSKFAMVTICNVLMNVTVLEPGFVEETPLFFSLLKFVMNSLPNLENSGEIHFSVVSSSSSSSFKSVVFIRGTIGFIWQFLRPWPVSAKAS